MDKYYLIKENVDLEILKNYGYQQFPCYDNNYIKFINNSHHKIEIISTTRRIILPYGEEELIQDLIDNKLVDKVKYNYEPIDLAPEYGEIETDTCIGLGEEMLK